MTCDQVRDQLAEHLLGTLEPGVDAAIRDHLRGCASCRAEMAALADGVSTLAAAAHDVEPPEDLRDRILTVLEDEWRQAPAPLALRRPRRWVRRVAAATAMAAALVWGVVATVQAVRFQEDADKYKSFLGALHGEDVRVGELDAAGPRQFEGSVVVYDSKVGQSWVLVLARAPGREGDANVTMIANGTRRIDLHPVEFGPGGEGSTWLVTAADLTRFDTVNVWDDAGLIASADLEHT